MITKPRYAVERVPAKFIGGHYSRLPWHVVRIGPDETRTPAGRAHDGQGRRYRTRRQAAEACRGMNHWLDVGEAQEAARAAAAAIPTPVDDAIAWLEGRR